MRITAMAGLVAAMAFTLPAAAKTAAKDAQPWVEASELLETVSGELQTEGLKAVGGHVEEMEAAVAGGAEAHALAASQGIYLTDGMTETIAAMAAAAAANDKSGGQSGGSATAVDDPYGALAFYLGSYHVETGEPAEALRVLDTALAIPRPVVGLEMDEHRPLLLVERGAAFTKLKRPADALGSYDWGLRVVDKDSPLRAPLLRGRGFALIELGRLDEAEAAYRESLEVEPGNDIALHELEYIQSQRKGAPRGEPEVTIPGAGVGGGH